MTNEWLPPEESIMREELQWKRIWAHLYKTSGSGMASGSGPANSRLFGPDAPDPERTPRRFTIFVCPVCGWGSKFPDGVRGTRDMCNGGAVNRDHHPLTECERIEVAEVSRDE